ncbi:RusA-like Holliday junction resolvase [Bacillus phage Moonbeam]|uniref:Resolvase n=1 Tax=Bacillus phage Moonbeam TaxID=1540091 RepID=A0A0A0RSK7_9CAUD|nr:RusA-like Holliday junction resolvase [Bacillus phage Moonbeam]AIW03501.1 hypothetical protein CPT_Moonbeam103 [Bacillus phage Moonbeam]
MASQGRGAKQKGSSYELKVAKFMTGWWGGNFNRTPGSGGMRWGTDQSIAGDIVPPKGMIFPFVIECKKHEGWVMDNVLLNTGKPREWFSQVVTDARRVKRTPLLIFSRNRAKDFVMLPYEDTLWSVLNGTRVRNIMRTTVEIKTLQDDFQYFDVMVTTLDCLSLVPLDMLVEYGKTVEWDAYADQYE